jgi:hypothetical protein
MFDLVCMVNQYWVVMEVIGERKKKAEITVEKVESFLLTLYTKLISHIHFIRNDDPFCILISPISRIFHY